MRCCGCWGGPDQCNNCEALPDGGLVLWLPATQRHLLLGDHKRQLSCSFTWNTFTLDIPSREAATRQCEYLASQHKGKTLDPFIQCIVIQVQAQTWTATLHCCSIYTEYWNSFILRLDIYCIEIWEMWDMVYREYSISVHVMFIKMRYVFVKMNFSYFNAFNIFI